MGQVILFALFVLIMLFAVCGEPVWRCDGTAERMGFDSSYSWSTGCMIKVEGRWVPIESYRTAAP